MRTLELDARRHAAAVASKMLLICCSAMLDGYSRQKKIAAVLPEMLVIMAIRVNEDEGGPPISVSRIATSIGMPRANVRRSLAHLIKHGVIEQSGKGYIGADAYLEARLRAPYFLRLIAAIRDAARELDGFE